MTSNSKLRIAVYHGLPAGGARRTAFEHAKYLSEEHEITFYGLGNVNGKVLDIRPYAKASHTVTFTPGKLFNPPLGRLDQGVRIADMLRLRAASQQIAAAINAENFDAVLIHPCQYAHVPWLLQFLDAPSVYYCHEHNRIVHEEQTFDRAYVQQSRVRKLVDHIDPLRLGYLKLLKDVEKRGLQRASRTLVNSLYIQAQIQRLYGLPTHVSYHGVDIKAFPALDLPRGDYVLSVGALAPHKGFDFIIKGLGHMPAHNRPRLVLVGYSQLSEELVYLKNLAEQYQVQLEIISGADHSTLVNLYNQALVTIYTPVREPFGLVPLESMACGTPVIGIAEGGVKETVLDGVTGRLVSRDPSELAAATADLIADPQLRAEMGWAGRSYIEREWSWEQAIINLERHIVEVAQGQT